MLKEQKYTVGFQLQSEVHEQLKKLAKKRGYKSPGLYVKDVICFSLTSASSEATNDDVLEEINALRNDEINALRDEVDRLWETLEKEGRQQRQFRKRVDETLTAILEQLQQPLATVAQSEPNGQQVAAQKRSALATEKNPLTERYARSRR